MYWPDNTTFKYKLILQYITVNGVGICIVFGRTDSHSLNTQFIPSTTTTILASPRVGGARWAWENLLSLVSFSAPFAHLFLEASACSCHLLCVPQQFLFLPNHFFSLTSLHIFIIKGIFINLFITHDGWIQPRHVHSAYKHPSCMLDKLHIIHLSHVMIMINIWIVRLKVLWGMNNCNNTVTVTCCNDIYILNIGFSRFRYNFHWLLRQPCGIEALWFWKCMYHTFTSIFLEHFYPVKHWFWQSIRLHFLAVLRYHFFCSLTLLRFRICGAIFVFQPF